MMFGRILIVLNAIIFFALAVMMLFSPERVLRSLSIVAETNSALIELQVLISGTFLGLTALCGMAWIESSRIAQGLLQLASLYGAWLVIRGITIWLTPPDGLFTYVYLGFEIVMVISLVFAYQFASKMASRALYSSDLETL
ncbi:DUF4345 family protein [Litorivicinus sp.]|nr:DUF4345 family protein [Litorivicinus sp.]